MSNTIDIGGSLSAQTEDKPIVTWTGEESVNIVSWNDESERVKSKEVYQHQFTKLKVNKTFLGDEAYEEQVRTFVNRNIYRDVSYNLIVTYEIPGYESHLLSYVDLEKKSMWLSCSWGWVATILWIPSLPYRVWLSSITGKLETTVHKVIKTA